MIKGIIFDYGGTIDTRGTHWSHILEDGYKHAEVLVDHEDFLQAYVYGERELARVLHILPHHNFHDLLLQKVTIELQFLASQSKFPPQLIAEKAAAIADYCYGQARECVDEAKPVLAKLADKYPLVLVSNFYGNIKTVLEDFGILVYFKKIIESAVVGVRKPDPKIFQLGIEALGLQPDEVLVVGDSLKKDIEPARSLGCATLWLRGRGWQEDTVPPIDDPSAITSLDQVLNFLS